MRTFSTENQLFAEKGCLKEQLLVYTDVTAAMLVVKNRSISLLWELNSISMLILREKKNILFTHSAWPPCHVVANQEYHNNIPKAFCVNYALEFYDYKHSLHNGEWPLNNRKKKKEK